ncbi:peptide-methionine (R)-S-oxide reductase MsrB [Petrocella sp. FN5]|uniref:peptide-methionine (R)-S-oxide reductase MsrB n=1 Tax=Petrocella sp. FN5 TaxID=3032002 RepID=UPI0023DB4978|nr:peptide-methionine (R)-S-oxide reductase MsrB [Petrocella sp. FN5]MDF1618594.1 peptide-methionine (R)-S-oxide reductase MsrB [Petrocella sp. FN5]
MVTTKIIVLALTVLLIFTACSGTNIKKVNTMKSAGQGDGSSEGIVEGRVSSKLVPPPDSPFPANPNLGVEFDMDKLDEIWLAGGCFWGVEAYMARVYGVYDATSGYANGDTENPSYKDVLDGSGHAETVHVTYDTSKVSLEELLEAFFRVVDPTSLNKQGNDIGASYRSGIYYTKTEDLDLITAVIEEEQKRYTDPIVTEVLPLNGYYLAETYHQDYLEKNPNGYCHIDFDELETKTMNYEKPAEEEIKTMLTPLQYKVTQENGTEPAFNNTYWDNHDAGIYVDIVTGEPLFSSAAKYESGTGWPSFFVPISGEAVIFKEDNTLFAKRVEVRSTIADSHLGHVFPDGPADKGGLRYCLNSAALRFVPYEKMEEEGYADYMNMVK